MNDMRFVIEPKTDQLNADSLITGPITIKVRDVKIAAGQEQPVSIFFDGDDNKPSRPCKSMCRVLVNCWGADANLYIGRSMTLYRDPKVKWGGLEVGGIRISHLSGIEREVIMALTETRASKKPFTVRPLKVAAPAEQSTSKAASWFEKALKAIAKAETVAAVDALKARADMSNAMTNPDAPEDIRKGLEAAFRDAYARLQPGDDLDDFPGVVTPREQAA